MTKGHAKVVLCADDFGLSDGVSCGILRLAQTGRISATSAMTNGPAWPGFASAVQTHRPGLAVGLHLTLTWGRPLGAMPALAPGGEFPHLGRLLRLAFTNALIAAEIAREIERQLDAFVREFGEEPDFVDGHQHVHVLPGIREALLETLVRRGLGGNVWLRNPAERPTAILGRRVSAGKAMFVAALSAGFGDAAGRRGFETNRGFSGFSDFRPDRGVAGQFDRYFSDLGSAHLVMCHPGEPGKDPANDEIAPSRSLELSYLTSDAFPELLARRGIVLTRSPLEAGIRSPAPSTRGETP